MIVKMRVPKMIMVGAQSGRKEKVDLLRNPHLRTARVFRWGSASPRHAASGSNCPCQQKGSLDFDLQLTAAVQPFHSELGAYLLLLQ